MPIVSPFAFGAPAFSMNARRQSKPKSHAGSLLVAHPVLRDPGFRRTVVLLSGHDPEGALGIVLNRPMNRSLGSLGGEFALGPLSEVPLFKGGPVAPQQVLLCAWRSQLGGESEGFQLMFGIDPDKAAELVGQPGVGLRAFLGYAGWSAGQLEKELKSDTWVVSNLPPTLMETSPDVRLWREVLGNVNAEWRLHANEPDDPSVN
ncbi:YqgE/AlgH family protein [Geminisphaera colitermitum]|uniref:YqgE/AlgH family protein n=1 Tax=Geminisphaera colitermitum TaxID=1148786 RepID=UPI001E2EBD09|nr:YqgE/AlgH family protein [Geminisphaera colitermitum]